MRIQSIFSVVLLSFLSLACKEVEVKDGIIPEEYRNEAKLLEHRYHGEIFTLWDGPGSRRGAHDVQQGTLQLQLDENNRLVFYTNFDFAGKGCQSKLGEVTRLGIDDNEKISTVEVSIDKGSCASKVIGSHVVFETNEAKDQLRINLERRVETRHGSRGRVYTYREWTRGLLYF